jgi:hypothetical protein
MPPVVAAFLIGVRFPSRWWPAGPPLAVLLAGTPLLLIPYDVVVPFTQSSMFSSMFQDTTYGEAMFIASLFLLFLMTITLVLYALAAYAGVKWSQRREAANVSSTGLSRDGDPAP